MGGDKFRRINGKSYTREEYILGTRPPRVKKFESGTLKRGRGARVLLKSEGEAQIQDIALEAARVAANKILRELGSEEYYLKVHVYPHQILREHKMLGIAHAERLQTGMRKAFGRAVGRGARVKSGQIIMSTRVPDEHLEVGKQALEVARSKLPVPCKIHQKAIEKT